MSAERAAQLLDLGRADEAERAYAEVLVTDPGDDDVRFGHGLALAALRELDAAVEEFDRVLARSPERTDARYHRAVLYSYLDRDVDAVAEFDRLLADGFREWYVWCDRAALRMKDGSIEAALLDLREAERIAPSEPAVRLNLGMALLAVDQPDDAFHNFAAAAEAGLPDAVSLRERARRDLASRITPRDVEAALDALSSATSRGDVRMLVDGSPALLTSTVLQALEGAARDRADAVRAALGPRLDDLRELAQSVRGIAKPAFRRPRDQPLPTATREEVQRYEQWAARLSALHRRGLRDEAVDLAPKVVELALRVYGTQSATAGSQLMGLAVLAAAEGAWDVAEWALVAGITILLEAEPEVLPDALVSYANALSAGGPEQHAVGPHELYEMAERLVRELPRGIDHDTVARVYRAYAEHLRGAGESAQAELMLRVAVGLPTLNAEGAEDALAKVLLSLSEAIFVQGRPAEAVPLTLRVVELARRTHGECHPSVANAMRGLGRVYWNAGELNQAVAWLERSESLWRQLADPDELALTQGDLAVVYARAGVEAKGRAAVERAQATLASMAVGSSLQAPYVRSHLRQAFQLLGDLDGELGVQQHIVDEATRAQSGDSPQQLSILADIYYRMRRYDDAQRWYSAALDAVLATTPVDPDAVAVLQHNLANVFSATGQSAAAFAQHEQALAAFRRVRAPGNPDLVQSLVETAESAYEEHQPDKARRLLDEARPFLAAAPEVLRPAAILADRLGAEPVSGEDYLLLGEEANTALHAGDDERAAGLIKRALTLATEVVGPRHPDVATLKFNLALTRIRSGTPVGAVELLREVVAIRADTLDPSDAWLTDARLELANALEREGRDAEAGELAEAVLRTDGIDGRPAPYGRAHTIAGLTAHRCGKLDAAEQHLRTAVRIADESREPSRQTTRRRNLILLLIELGRLQEADELTEEALLLCQESFGLDNRATAQAALTRAKVQYARGRFPESELLARQVVDQLERLDVPGDDQVLVDAYNEVSRALHGQNRWQQAEAWSRRALAAASARGGRHTLLLNQAMLALDAGNVERAQALSEQAVDELAERVGTDDPRYGHALGVLGDVELHGGRPGEAIQHLVEAHRVLAAAYGPDHPSLLGPLSAMAGEYLRVGARKTGLSFARRAAVAARAAYGDAHPGLAPHLLVLARGEAMEGNTDEAVRLAQAAVDRTPTSSVNRRLLVWLHAALGDHEAALDVLRQMVHIEDAELPDVLAGASEVHRRAFLTRIWETVETFLTVALAAEGADLAREAWDLVSRRRGLNAEHLRSERRAAYGSGRTELARLLRELSDVRAKLARATYGNDLGTAQRLTARREELEQLLATRVTSSSGTVMAPRGTVPADTVYVEYVHIAVIDVANLAFGRAPEGVKGVDRLDPRPRHRYVAFVVVTDEVADDGVEVYMVDLGAADPVDDLVKRFREDLVPGDRDINSARSSRDGVGLALREQLLDPLLGLVGSGRHRLLVVADGSVALLPVQVLPARDGRLVIEDYSVAYLESAWDLGRRREPSRYHLQEPPLIVADPEFDLGGGGGTSAGIVAPRLPGTRDEGAALSALLATTPVIGAEAVKMVLEEARSPRLVHLATHGLFLATPEAPPPGNAFGVLHIVDVPGEGQFVARVDPRPPKSSPTAPGLPGTDSDPLLRSAVVLAGFNTWLAGGNPPSEAGNGLLTADEVCALDLQHTALVVLSACETGLGDPRPTEGLVGLRWAFSVAGARSVVTSLWSVPDDATRELMTEFYARLLTGAAVPDALRAAQLALRRRSPDPYSWGAFVCHGDPLTALRPDA